MSRGAAIAVRFSQLEVLRGPSVAAGKVAARLRPVWDNDADSKEGYYYLELLEDFSVTTDSQGVACDTLRASLCDHSGG